MKVVLAPDGFKDALGAAAACEAMARGVRRAAPEARIAARPIADGGEGFVDAFASVPGSTRRITTVTGPLGDPVDAAWVLREDRGTGPARRTAVIELAQAAGLEQVPVAQRDPTVTTTFGVGELIAAALDAGADRILLGVGGSATNDAGCGLAQALGVRFFDAQDRLMVEPITGGDLSRIGRTDTRDRRVGLEAVELIVACDVTNPLHGPDGAAHVYAPQKGATAAQVETLDAALASLEAQWRDLSLWPKHDATAGFGAAGGTAGGAVCLLGATLQPGADLVLDAVGFDHVVRDADLVLTGEGKLDGQSLSGKAVLKVAQRAAASGVPTVALVGCVGEAAERCLKPTLPNGLDAYEVLAVDLPAAESIARTAELLADAAERVLQRSIPQ
jgi:glycerate kinase